MTLHIIYTTELIYSDPTYQIYFGTDFSEFLALQFAMPLSDVTVPQHWPAGHPHPPQLGDAAVHRMAHPPAPQFAPSEEGWAGGGGGGVGRGYAGGGGGHQVAPSAVAAYALRHGSNLPDPRCVRMGVGVGVGVGLCVCVCVSECVSV